MKKPIWILSLAIGIAVASCQTQAEKDAKAENRAQDSIATQQANQEYLTFKRDADNEIIANNGRIARLRERLAKTQGTAPLDDARRQKIDNLEKRNADLRVAIVEYKYQNSDWVGFKTKWYHDRDNIRDAFRDAEADLNK